MRSLNNLASRHSFNSFSLNLRSFLFFLGWWEEKKGDCPLWWRKAYTHFLLINSSTKIETKHLDLISSLQLPLQSCPTLCDPWIAVHQASLSITNSLSSPKLMSIESVMPSSHLILCRPLLLLPPIPPSIRVFSNEPTLCMRWPKYWSFSFGISPSKKHPGLISFRMD